MNKLWQDASIEDRMNVVNTYNKYYNNNNDPLCLEKADAFWYDKSWILIKYTFGIEPS